MIVAEISKSDRTLWVNAEKCLGRICRFGIMSPTRLDDTLYHYPVGGVEESDWELFKVKVKEIHGIEITETPPEKLFTNH